eukprot:s2252_g8.t1
MEVEDVSSLLKFCLFSFFSVSKAMERDRLPKRHKLGAETAWNASQSSSISSTQSSAFPSKEEEFDEFPELQDMGCKEEPDMKEERLEDGDGEQEEINAEARQDPGPTREDLDKLGILRKIDPHKTATALIREGKAGWSPNPQRPSTENLANALARYTLGQVSQPMTFQVKPVGEGQYQATLTTVLSDKVYVGGIADDELAAKRSAASLCLQTPAVKLVLENVPPTVGAIRNKVRLDENERRRCNELKCSSAVTWPIVRERVSAVLSIFRDMGYHMDLWDQVGLNQ